MLGKEPLVSIIMNCYNGEKFLREAIDSVYAQSHKNWEIIFWDNCSTDSSASIARSYSEKIKYFYGEKNIKLYAARNLALEKCSGEFIAFLDCDDHWLPEKLSVQIAAMNKYQAGLCYASYVEKEQASNSSKFCLVQDSPNVDFSSLINNYNIGILTAVVRKKDMLAFNDQMNYAGDQALFLKLANTTSVISVSATLAVYRVHGNAFTHKIPYQEKAQECDVLINYVGPTVAQKDKKFFLEKIASEKKVYLLWDAIKTGSLACFRKLAKSKPFNGHKLKFCLVLAYCPDFILRPILRRL